MTREPMTEEQYREVVLERLERMEQRLESLEYLAHEIRQALGEMHELTALARALFNQRNATDD